MRKALDYVNDYQQKSACRDAIRTTTTIGRRNFAVAGPTTWNSLPIDLWTSSLSRDTFAKNSKPIYLAASALDVYSNWALYKLTYSHSSLRRATHRTHGSETATNMTTKWERSNKRYLKQNTQTTNRPDTMYQIQCHQLLEL